MGDERLYARYSLPFSRMLINSQKEKETFKSRLTQT